MAARKQNVETAEQIAVTEAAQTAPKPRKVKAYTPKMTDEVIVRNMHHGKLNYTAPGSAFGMTWDDYDSVQPMLISELVTMRNAYPSFFKRNWIMIDDPHAEEILRFLRVNAFYDNFKDPDEILAIFEKEPDEMYEAVVVMTDSMKETVARIAYGKIKDGSLDSRKAITMLERATGYELEG